MAKKATARKRKRTTKPTTPAHPDLGKEFYIHTDSSGVEISHYRYQSINWTKTDCLDSISEEYDGDSISGKSCKVFKVRIVEVGVDETNPIDNRKWYSENTKTTKK